MASGGLAMAGSQVDGSARAPISTWRRRDGYPINGATLYDKAAPLRQDHRRDRRATIVVRLAPVHKRQMIEIICRIVDFTDVKPGGFE
jgi:hypothetical protein